LKRPHLNHDDKVLTPATGSRLNGSSHDT